MRININISLDFLNSTIRLLLSSFSNIATKISRKSIGMIVLLVFICHFFQLYQLCFLLQKNFRHTEYHHQKVQDTVREVDLVSKILLGILFGILIIFLGIFSQYDLKKATWIVARLALRSAPILRGNPKKAILIVAFISAFLIQTFFSCVVQTNRLSRSEGFKIDSYEDVIKTGFVMIVIPIGKCKTVFEKSPQATRKDFGIHMKIYQNTGSDFQFLFHQKYVTFMEDYLAAAAIELSCILYSTTYGQLTLSSQPIIKSPESQYFHKNLDERKKKDLTRWGYASLEMGFNQREKTLFTGLMQNSLKTRANPGCTMIAEPEIQVVSLEFSFFSDFLKFYYLMCYISALLFVYFRIKASWAS